MYYLPEIKKTVANRRGKNSSLRIKTIQPRRDAHNCFLLNYYTFVATYSASDHNLIVVYTVCQKPDT